MKNHFFISMLSILIICKASNASSALSKFEVLKTDSDTGIVNIDTVVMIKNAVSNKSIYIGKPLGNLLNDLSIPVKSCIIVNSKIDEISGLIISFDSYESTINKKERKWSTVLHIIWDVPITIQEYKTMMLQKNQGDLNWSNVDQGFYSTRIVQDIGNY